ncbi:vreteno isoform X2 [Halictus rubicundus]|uniref:vreteno isoform X2 n=1 Tax=Halictus rubicundus TaxID=77578 RepID=UPI00403592FE
MAYYEPSVLTEDSPANGSTSAEFTLYVTNLPEELDEHGFLQIFNHYGKVIGHFYRSNVAWGYITYGTCHEAQNAIKDLNNVPPLRLKVSLSRERGSKDMKFIKAPVHEDNRYSIKQENNCMGRPFIQTIGRGRPMDVFKTIEPNVGLPSYNYTVDNDLLYNYPTDHYTYNPYENPGPYQNTNSLWTRGQLTTSQNGKRHVSLGRGYTMYEIPQPNPKISNYISNVYEKRASGFYEYGNDTLENVVGKCKECGKITKFSCETCHTFYCSKNCQVADWPQHKIECQSVPALVAAVKSVHMSQNHNEEQTHSRSISSVQLPLRRPKKSQFTTASQNNDVSSCDPNKQDIIDTTAKPKMNDIKYSNQSDVFESTDQCNIPLNQTDKFKSTPIQSTNDRMNKLRGNKNHGNQAINDYINTSFKKSHDSLPSSDKTIDHKKSDSFEAKKRQNFGVKDVTKMEKDIAFSNQILLSKSKFTDVKIIINDGREYWVQKLEDNDEIIELMTNLQRVVEDAKKIKPIVGEIYAVQYECLWHRALVKSLDPVTVHYIDFGNDEVVNEPDFRKIPQLIDIPSYAVRIRLSEKALKKHRNLDYEDVISVKMISIDENKVINVEVQGENDAPTVQSEKNGIAMPEVQNLAHKGVPTAVLKALQSKRTASPVGNDSKKTATTQKPESVVKTLSVGDSGVIEIHAELSSHVYSVTLLPNKAISNYEKLFQHLTDVCNQAGKNSNHRPQIGDLVCGKTVNYEEWVRGYVLSLEEPRKIAVIDDASITEVVEIVPCPDNFLDICAFGAKCKIIDSKKKFAEKMHPEFEVLARKNQNEIEIKINDEEAGEVMAVVKPWTPAPEQKGLQYATLNNKSEVFLTAYRSHVAMFVRSSEDTKHYHHVMQSVAKHAQSGSPLSEPPVVGQMVIAHYADDNYYRAIVTKVEGNKIAISYVDFGNTEVTNLKKLKILSDELKQLRSCTSKVVLKNVPQDVPMTKEINEYLGHLVSAEIALTCVFEGIPSKDGVYLTTLSGECINKTISEMLVPTWNKSEKEDTKCYMKTDLNIATIGAVGDVVDAIVLYAIQDGYTYSMCPMDYELMSHIFDVMPKMMAEYCEKSEYYIPRDNELCLAHFDNAWNRAICYRRTETAGSSSIFFVDYGNLELVPHKNIRLMPKDFITPNAIANICNVVNLAPTNDKKEYSPEIEKRLSELIQVNTRVKLKVVECDEDDGYYTVEIPSVRDQLIQEGLVPQ